MELFALAIKEGSFSAAARRSGMYPASVSRYIAELEGYLGVQLLNRTTRSLSLTEAGQLYYNRIDQILRDIKDAESIAKALQTTPTGTLQVHSRTLFGTTVIGPVLAEFQRRYCDLQVELSMSEQPVTLRDDEYDVDIRLGAPQEMHLMQRKLLQNDRYLVATPGYLADMPAIGEPEDLLAHRCLTYLRSGEETIWRFSRNGQLKELHIDGKVTSNNGLLLRNLALIGHGIVLLDAYSVSSEIANGSLTRILPEWRATNTAFDQGIYAVYRDLPYVPAKVQVFVDFLAEHSRRVR